MTSEPSQEPKWIGPATDFGPLVVFFVAYMASGLMAATAAIMVATLIALVTSWLVRRTIPTMAVVTAVLVGVFGGLTLYLQDETFIKIKPTIIQGVIAAILLGGVAMGKSLLKYVMGKAMPLDEQGWRKLSFRFGLFFAAMAVLNELVWRTQSTDTWVAFKVWGLMGLTFAFAMTQVKVMERHRLPDADEPTGTGPTGSGND
ncbi:MAG: septation protein A [Alphaproteobacteria bacterium]|jgi:intracellular septation protein